MPASRLGGGELAYREALFPPKERFGKRGVCETESIDIIHRLYHKLKLEDRLSWNEERRQLGRVCSLGSLGSWICRRAAACLTDECLVAAQRRNPIVQTHSKFSHQREKKRVRTRRATNSIAARYFLTDGSMARQWIRATAVVTYPVCPGFAPKRESNG